MIRLRYKQTLLYFDTELLVQLEDPVGTNYVGLLVDDSSPELRYCCVPVSPARLTALRVNQIDLRLAFEQPELGQWGIAQTGDVTAFDSPIDLVAGPVPEDYLPESGFYLAAAPTGDDLVLFARKRASLVSEVKVEPPESSTHIIAASTLSQLLANVQSLVRYAGGVVRRARNLPGIRRTDEGDPYLLNVLAFQPGSFSVRFVSSNQLDLYGDPELESALELIDSIFSGSKSPDSIVELLGRSRGHFVTTLVRLLRLLEAQKSYITLGWALPHFTLPRASRIEANDATRFLAFLTQRQELQIESVTLVGILEKADTIPGAWRIKNDEDGREYSGTLRGEGLSLAGKTIGRRYRVVCLEEIEETLYAGRNITRLYATQFDEI